MTTDEEPETYLRAAFAAVGIPLHRLQITDYDPQLFGNFVAYASTDIGPMKITYDRAFFVRRLDEGKDSIADDPLIRGLADAFELAKRSSEN
jgi:hypothetical protein